MNLFQTTEAQIPNKNAIITAFINNQVRFHTIQLFRKSSLTDYKPEGTGVLVNFFGIYCLFTNKQILENSFESDLLYFKLGQNEYILCTGNTDESEPKRKRLDITYIILDLTLAESLIEIGYKFLTTDKILPNHQALETPQYAIVGFPKPTSGQEQENTHTNGSYIIAPMAPDTYYDNHNYTKENCLIMPYAPPQEIMTGIKSKSKELCDMSGSGLWFISITKNHETIEYNYHLIGIITELYLHKRNLFLIASKINLLTDQLKEAIS